MMGFEWILFVPTGLAVLGYGMISLANVGQDLFNGDGGHQRRFEEFTMDARRHGLSARETLDELDCRVAFAKLRRVSSDRLAAMGDAEEWHRRYRGVHDADLRHSRRQVVPMACPIRRGRQSSDAGPHR